MARTDPLFIQSLAKGLGLLEAFRGQPAPLTLNDLSEQSGLDRSTTQRMAHTLVALGYLERGSNGRGYVPGKKILDCAFDYLRSVPLLERATPLIVELQKDSGERVELSLFDDLTIVFALRRQTKRQTYTTTLIGRRLATLHTAGGRAIMAHLTDAQNDDILARAADTPVLPMTPKAIKDPARIRELIEEARAHGYAMAAEESMLGEINLACAVTDHEERPIAAIHISGSLAEWTMEDFAKRFSPLILGAARALSGKRGLS
ncbi:IclR family transcriptional regulator [Schauerella aestuarii]|uniref:IclR family transcriptional regulator n=1 Tax=Schauerella aestuarii TaxID=2511204 RepID=UPI00136C7549|nr:IclR family transcriptional regulator [Achromobacter aestuarii]MYZ41540.1 IclR family transcriptional regulator [Achromobacter aestuarii]